MARNGGNVPSNDIEANIAALAAGLQQNFNLNVDAQVTLDRAAEREQLRSQQTNLALGNLSEIVERSHVLAQEATNTANAALRAAQNAGGGAQGPRPQKIDQKTFPKLKIVKGEDQANNNAFRIWETSVRSVIETNDLRWPQTGTGIIGSLNEGGAGVYTQHLYQRLYHEELRPNGDIRNLDQLLVALREKLIGHCYREKARALFDVKTQSASEGIITYHGDFDIIHRDAFENPQDHQNVLIDHFISGLRNREVMRDLIKNRPATYSAALTQALEQEGYSERFQLNQARIKNGGQLPTRYLNAPRGKTANRSNAGEPMDVDNVNRRDQPKAGNAKNVWKQGQKHPQRNEDKQKGKKKDIKCYNCDLTGHIAKNCRKPKRKRKAANVNSVAPGGNKQAADPDTETQEEETEFSEYESDRETDSDSGN